ncbi:MAG TPA: thioredoxin family protein [Terriglobia bacterium]|nr:thioredoxin family protein [Terriglobia bacterium]
MTQCLKIASSACAVSIAFAAAVLAAGSLVYNETADAHQQIAAAVAQASRSGKNIVLDFGANWCLDCHVLDAQMSSPGLAQLVERNYVVVHVDVGLYSKNLDLAQKYGIPLRKGIPALAVLDSHGKLLYSQDQGQFEDARYLGPDSFKQFFEQWRPKKGG